MLARFLPVLGFLLAVALVAAGAAAIYWPVGLIVAGFGVGFLFYEPPSRAEP